MKDRTVQAFKGAALVASTWGGSLTFPMYVCTATLFFMILEVLFVHKQGVVVLGESLECDTTVAKTEHFFLIQCRNK